MKKLSEVVKEHPDYATLIRAVVRRIGLDSVEDVNGHGIDGGFSGFIYTKDTSAFFVAFRKDILKLAGEMASEMGEGVLEMVQSFRCLGEAYSLDEIGRALYGHINGRFVEDADTDTIRNAMAWFAAEEVCRMFED